MRFVVTETWQYTKTAVVDAENYNAAKAMSDDCEIDTNRQYDDECIRVNIVPENPVDAPTRT